MRWFHFVLAVSVSILSLGSTLYGQSRGTSSASELGTMGTGKGSAKEKPIILTKETIDEWLRKEVHRIDGRLRAAKKGGISQKASGVVWIEKSGRYQFHSRADRDAEIARLESELKLPTLPPLNPFRLVKGQIGSIGDLPTSHMPYRVLQIADRNMAMIEASTNLNATFFLSGSIVEKLQEDQQERKFAGTYIVEEKHRFTSGGGAARAIPLVREYDIQPHLEPPKEESAE